MDSINYRIKNRKKERSLSIEALAIEFMDSDEFDNYHVYHYRFSTCFYKFISAKIIGIRPLELWQYDKIENEVKLKLKAI